MTSLFQSPVVPDPTTPTGKFACGNELLAAGRWGEAFLQFEAIRPDTPPGRQATALLMRILLWEGRPKAAIDLRVQRHPDPACVFEPDAVAASCHAWLLVAEPEKALDMLVWQSRQAGREPPPYLHACCLAQCGHVLDAMEALQRIVQAAASEPVPWPCWLLDDMLAPVWMSWDRREPLRNECSQLESFRKTVGHVPEEVFFEPPVSMSVAAFHNLPSRFHPLFEIDVLADRAVWDPDRMHAATLPGLEFEVRAGELIDQRLAALRGACARLGATRPWRMLDEAMVLVEEGDFGKARRKLTIAAACNLRVLDRALELEHRFACILPALRELRRAENAAPGFCRELLHFQACAEPMNMGRLDAILAGLEARTGPSPILDDLRARTACLRWPGFDPPMPTLPLSKRCAAAWPLEADAFDQVGGLLADALICQRQGELPAEVNWPQLEEWLESSPPGILLLQPAAGQERRGLPPGHQLLRDETRFYPAFNDDLTFPFRRHPEGAVGVAGLLRTPAGREKGDASRRGVMLGFFHDPVLAWGANHKFLMNWLEAIHRPWMDARLLLAWARRLGLQVAFVPATPDWPSPLSFLLNAVAAFLRLPLADVEAAYAATITNPTTTKPEDRIP